jgi:tRNA G18 (ribose-2'-O)-methylase SpoU
MASDGIESGIGLYRNLKDSDLRKREICIGEGIFVVERMIDAPSLDMISVLCVPHLAEHFTKRASGRFPVIVSHTQVISDTAGFDFHRGVMAAARRPFNQPLPDFLALRPDASRIILCTRVSELENIGSIIRSGRAFGFDALVLGPGSCDPFNRKAIRVSMAGCFMMPILEADFANAAGILRARGFILVAATTSERARSIQSMMKVCDGAGVSRRVVESNGIGERFDPGAKYAIVFGSEGSGLGEEELRACDLEVTIPIDTRADSLNVGVAAGIFLHYFGKYG